MSDRCNFSYGPVGIPQGAERYTAQCPYCGAIRESVRRGAVRVFPQHAPLMATPQDRACWKLSAAGVWEWKPVEYVATIAHTKDGIILNAERKQG